LPAPEGGHNEETGPCPYCSSSVTDAFTFEEPLGDRFSLERRENDMVAFGYDDRPCTLPWVASTSLPSFFASSRMRFMGAEPGVTTATTFDAAEATFPKPMLTNTELDITFFIRTSPLSESRIRWVEGTSVVSFESLTLFLLQVLHLLPDLFYLCLHIHCQLRYLIISRLRTWCSLRVQFLHQKIQFLPIIPSLPRTSLNCWIWQSNLASSSGCPPCPQESYFLMHVWQDRSPGSSKATSVFPSALPPPQGPLGLRTSHSHR